MGLKKIGVSLLVTQRDSVQPGPRLLSTLLFGPQANPNHMRSQRKDNFLLEGICDVMLILICYQDKMEEGFVYP